MTVSSYWRMLRGLVVPAPVSAHRVFERKGFRYPQRLLSTFAVSVFASVVLVLVIAMGAQWFDYQMDIIMNDLTEYNLKYQNYIASHAQELNLAGNVTEKLYGTEYNSDDVPDLAALMVGRFATVIFNPNSSPSDTLIRALNNLYLQSKDAIPRLIKAVQWAMATGAAVAFLFVVIVWLLMLAEYKRKIFNLRQGHYWFHDMDLYPVKNTPMYLGLQLGHILISFFILFFFVTCISFCVYFKLLFDKILPMLLTTFLIIFTGSFWIKFILGRVGNFVTDGKQGITRLALFSLYDFLMVVSWIPAGVVKAIVIFALALGKVIFGFARLDKPRIAASDDPFQTGELLACDTGYAIYLGCLISDYLHHNPVLRVAVYLLLRPIEAQRKMNALLHSDTEGYTEFIDLNGCDMELQPSPMLTRPAMRPILRVCRRFCKLITIARNPSIAPTSKRYHDFSASLSLCPLSPPQYTNEAVGEKNRARDSAAKAKSEGKEEAAPGRPEEEGLKEVTYFRPSYE